MKGFMLADIIGAICCCSLGSFEAAASESLESEFELLLELLFELLPPELLLDDDDDDDEPELLPPLTKFWKNSCNRPHSAGLAGIRQTTAIATQATHVASFIADMLYVVDFVLDFILRLQLGSARRHH